MFYNQKGPRMMMFVGTCIYIHIVYILYIYIRMATNAFWCVQAPPWKPKPF